MYSKFILKNNIKIYKRSLGFWFGEAFKLKQQNSITADLSLDEFVQRLKNINATAIPNDNCYYRIYADETSERFSFVFVRIRFARNEEQAFIIGVTDTDVSQDQLTINFNIFPSTSVIVNLIVMILLFLISIIVWLANKDLCFFSLWIAVFSMIVTLLNFSLIKDQVKQTGEIFINYIRI
jgi:ATP-dependent Zn protease